MKQDLLNAFQAATATPDAPDQWVAPYRAPEDAATHQFVLFLKPEATAVSEGARLDRILDIVFDRLAAFSATVHAARVLPGDYLARHAIMDQHYGVINRISKLGEAALTGAAREKLHHDFAKEIAAGARVLGGHQFLDEQPEISPLALSTMNDNIGTAKLGGGSYLMRLNVLGKNYLLLNPFHAYQLVPFTTPGHAIIVLEGRSKTPWKDLRVKLTGATNPAKAEAGSIRAAFLARKDELGLRDVNQGANGIHLSAGPLEGMVELQRFFHETGKDLSLADTAFAKLLASRGLSAERIAELAGNPVLDQGGRHVSAFDLTEETDALGAADALATPALV